MLPAARWCMPHTASTICEQTIAISLGCTSIPPLVGVCASSHASGDQGELFIIDDSNNIFYLPCGDLCIEDTGTIDDDSLSIPDSYIYLGCYADDSSRVLSGKYDTSDPGMTTEVRPG